MDQPRTVNTNFIKEAIRNHPTAAGILIAILVVLVIVLFFYMSHYKEKSKSGFQTLPYSNLVTGSNNPEWQLGSMDAGNWGPVHRNATELQTSIYHPRWRHHREGLATSPNPCGPGEVPVQYTEPDGTVITHCQEARQPISNGCPGWNPEATAEAQALSTAGSYERNPTAERRLQKAVDGAHGSGSTLSDEQLTEVMHRGGI